MRNIMIAAFILCTTSTFLHGQSTDRFIRIIGNAQKEFTASGIAASVSIDEQPENKNSNQIYIPFEAAYTNFLEELFTLGVTESQLKQHFQPVSKYNNKQSSGYILRMEGVDAAEKLFAIKAPGVQVTELNYTYSADMTNTESQLASEAIDDARNKAKILCADLKMKLGKILNIEDSSSGCCHNLSDSKTSKTTKSYQVSVTFELLD